MSSGHEGHRQRLIKKLSTGALADHELLELILFYAVPRKNTNGTAHDLLSAFGDLRSVFSASEEQLQTVDGVGKQSAVLLNCAGQIFERIKAQAKPTYPRKFDQKQFVEFVKREYSNLFEEVLDAYLLKQDRTIFFHKRFTSESESSVQIEPSEFTKILVAHKPAGVIFVHNHPSGNSEPSEQDDAMTFQCQFLCSAHNVIICDHFIYSPTNVYSYYGTGRMQKISKNARFGDLLPNNFEEFFK